MTGLIAKASIAILQYLAARLWRIPCCTAVGIPAAVLILLAEGRGPIF